MVDYSKLTNYLNDNRDGVQSSQSADSIISIDGLKNSVSGFFSRSQSSSRISTNNNPQDEQIDSWFREADNDQYCPKLNRKQRIFGFMACILLGSFFMFIASLYIPIILLKSRKFVLLFSTGSIFFLASFSLLWGVKSHVKHLFSKDRLPFTLAYFGTLICTIYVSVFMKSVILTLVFAVLQVFSLVWYLISYLPGGQNALKLFAKLFYSLASKTVQTTMSV